MSCASQSMMNDNLFMNQSSQLGIFSSLISFTYLPLMEHCNQTLTLSTQEHLLPPPTLSHHHHFINNFGASQKSQHDFRAWGGISDCANTNGGGLDDLVTISTSKIKKVKGRRIVRDPRFCFKTMSDVDILEDGYKWRKYGQKVVKNTLFPRSYYRCTQNNCHVKKRVERLADDSRMVLTTYEGRHIHSPSQQEEDMFSSSFFSTL